VAEETNGVLHLQLLGQRAQGRLQGPTPGDVELKPRHLPPRLRERAQQHDVSLDRNQPPDTEQSRLIAAIRLRRAVGVDAVVDDLEARAVETLDLLEVAGETTRDGNVRVRKARNRAVAQGETAVLAELVEAVLRRDAHRDTGERPGQLPVDVGVHEMGVQDARTASCEVPGEPQERDRIHVRGKRDRIERNAARRQLAGEIPRTRLVLVQHQETHVPPALLQPWQQREQVSLRARDARDLLQMQDGSVAVHEAAARIPSAHVSTEWRCATRSRSVRPISARSAALSPANQRSRSARLSGDSRSNESGKPENSSSKTGFDASTGRHAAAAS
jgi:hypothetical protein